MDLEGLKFQERAKWHIRTLTPEKEGKKAGQRRKDKTAGSPQANLPLPTFSDQGGACKTD